VAPEAISAPRPAGSQSLEELALLSAPTFARIVMFRVMSTACICTLGDSVAFSRRALVTTRLNCRLRH